MQWYENMTKEQQTKFKKVIAVSIVGIIVIVLIPMCFQSFFKNNLELTELKARDTSCS